jgi:hypothetical protein
MPSAHLSLADRPQRTAAAGLPMSVTAGSGELAAGSVTARFVGVLCGLFVTSLILIELLFSMTARDVPSDRPYVVSGEVPVVLYGAGRPGHCFVDDAYRSVPQGTLKPGGVGRTRMLRIRADGAPKRIECSNHIRVIESRFVPMYALIDSERPIVLGAIGLLAGTYLGWPLRLRRRPEVSPG